jgi:hypothetical protein
VKYADAGGVNFKDTSDTGDEKAPAGEGWGDFDTVSVQGTLTQLTNGALYSSGIPCSVCPEPKLKIVNKVDVIATA